MHEVENIPSRIGLLPRVGCVCVGDDLLHRSADFNCRFFLSIFNMRPVFFSTSSTPTGTPVATTSSRSSGAFFSCFLPSTGNHKPFHTFLAVLSSSFLRLPFLLYRGPRLLPLRLLAWLGLLALPPLPGHPPNLRWLFLPIHCGALFLFLQF